MMFLILAALYERWSLPIAVVLAVPYAFLGAMTAIWLRGTPNDIYFQIGLLAVSYTHLDVYKRQAESRATSTSRSRSSRTTSSRATATTFTPSFPSPS